MKVLLKLVVITITIVCIEGSSQTTTTAPTPSSDDGGLNPKILFVTEEEYKENDPVVIRDYNWMKTIRPDDTYWSRDRGFKSLDLCQYDIIYISGHGIQPPGYPLPILGLDTPSKGRNRKFIDLRYAPPNWTPKFNEDIEFYGKLKKCAREKKKLILLVMYLCQEDQRILLKTVPDRIVKLKSVNSRSDVPKHGLMIVHAKKDKLLLTGLMFTKVNDVSRVTKEVAQSHTAEDGYEIQQVAPSEYKYTKLTLADQSTSEFNNLNTGRTLYDIASKIASHIAEKSRGKPEKFSHGMDIDMLEAADPPIRPYIAIWKAKVGLAKAQPWKSMAKHWHQRTIASKHGSKVSGLYTKKLSAYLACDSIDTSEKCALSRKVRSVVNDAKSEQVKKAEAAALAKKTPTKPEDVEKLSGRKQALKLMEQVLKSPMIQRGGVQQQHVRGLLGTLKNYDKDGVNEEFGSDTSRVRGDELQSYMERRIEELKPLIANGEKQEKNIVPTTLTSQERSKIERKVKSEFDELANKSVNDCASKSGACKYVYNAWKSAIDSHVRGSPVLERIKAAQDFGGWKKHLKEQRDPHLASIKDAKDSIATQRREFDPHRKLLLSR